MALPSTNKKCVFSTTDVFGNDVYLTEKTWAVKRDRHPEVAGKLVDIQATVETAEGYRCSTHEYAYDTIALEKTSSETNERFRVIVQYEAATFLAGDTTGKITTVYLPGASYKEPTTLGPLIPIVKAEKEDEK